MNIGEALDAVIARTGHERFRQLCDPAHPDHDPAYIPLVIAMAAPGWPPDPPVRVDYGTADPPPCRGCPGG